MAAFLGSSAILVMALLLVFVVAAVDFSNLHLGFAGGFASKLRARLAELAAYAYEYDLPFFVADTPSAGDIVAKVVAARALTLPANCAGSRAHADVAATGSAAFSIQKNGVEVGTATFGGGGSTATFATSGGSGVSFVAGDRLSVVAPAYADDTLANIALTLLATKA